MDNKDSLANLEPQVMYVSEEGYKFLVKLLEEPPKPNEVFSDAFKKYKENKCSDK